MSTEDNSISPCKRILFHIYLFIFCVLILVFGIIGNSTVLFIYTRRLNVLIFGLFIKVLAVFDLLTICTAIPCLMVLRFLPNQDASTICKMLTFLEHCSVMNSGIIFVIIAVQRFRKICRPHRKQISEGLAKKLIVSSVLLSTLGSIPVLILVGHEIVTVKWDNKTVPVTICNYNSTSHNIISKLYAAWISVEIVGITSSLVILYIIIARTLKALAVKRLQSLSPGANSRSVRKQTSTVIFFVLTVVFLLTSSPMVIASFYFSVEEVDKTWPHLTLTAFDLSVNLLFINCIVNPIVYSFISSVFRRECKAVVRTLATRRNGPSNNLQLQTTTHNGSTSNLEITAISGSS